MLARFKTVYEYQISSIFCRIFAADQQLLGHRDSLSHMTKTIDSQG